MNIFDIIGPVMIGPSSSHTAGAVRIGRIAGALLAEPPVKADIMLHGSFAKTYRGHGTDKALAAGIMGMNPDDSRIRGSLKLAEEAGLQITFTPGYLEGAHPNSARISLKSASGKKVEIIGSSVGGGNILISNINGMEVSVSGEYTTLVILHKDTPGAIAAVTSYIGANRVNIANFRLARLQKGGTAIMTIELDGIAGEDINKSIQTMSNIISSTLLQPV